MRWSYSNWLYSISRWSSVDIFRETMTWSWYSGISTSVWQLQHWTIAVHLLGARKYHVTMPRNILIFWIEALSDMIRWVFIDPHVVSTINYGALLNFRYFIWYKLLPLVVTLTIFDSCQGFGRVTPGHMPWKRF